MNQFKEIKVPTLIVSCPVCGAVIFASVLDKKYYHSLSYIDFIKSTYEAIYNYGKQGCVVSVVESGSFKLRLCEHTKNLK